MNERKCRTCKETKPLTEEFYYKNNMKSGYYHFYTECKVCNNERRRYNFALARARKEKAEEDKWMDEFKDRIFTCKQCGKEKTFDLMRKDKPQKRVQSWCKSCYNLKAKDYNEMSKANSFVKVLRERRENQKRSELNNE